MKNSAYLSARYQHDGAGRILARLLSDGAQTQYTWNASQLTGIKTITANGTQLNNTSYTRDRVGNVLNQNDGSGTTTYTYDGMYQIKTADYPNTVNDESYVYDSVGNRSTHTLNGQVHAYEFWPNSNRLNVIHATNIAGAIEKSFIYDDEGRLTSQTGTGAKTLIWDQKNRAKQITAGSNANAFNYDPMNYRIGRTGGTLGNRDYYLEGEHLEAEYSGSNLQAKYFRGLSTDELVAGYAYDASGNWVPSIYHHDNLMSVTGISTNDGASVQTSTYSAFGDRAVTGTGSSKNRLTYTGREMDADSGLMYYRARYYDPSIGRFISEDPLGFKGSGVNWYAYVGNNPITRNDPSGLYWFRQDGQPVGVVGRADTIVPPGKAISQFVEQYVPAGYTLGVMHDGFVDAATGAGIPFVLANIPSMIPTYLVAVGTEVLRTLGIVDQPTILAQLGPQSSNNSGAAGGFLIYPNKPNTNQMQSVYAKP